MSKASANPKASERRRSNRRPILDTFSLFAVVPKKGVHRLPVHDLSEQGIAFDLDIEGEAHEQFPIAIGEKIELLLYLNQSLYLPLSGKVMRVDDKSEVRKIGAELSDTGSASFKGYAAFLQLLEVLAESGQIDK
jgi:hypothetical protein